MCSSSQPNTLTLPPSSTDGIEPMQIDSTHQDGKSGDAQDIKSKLPTTPGASVPTLPSGGMFEVYSDSIITWVLCFRLCNLRVHLLEHQPHCGNVVGLCISFRTEVMVC